MIRKIVVLVGARRLLRDTKKRVNYFDKLGQTQIQTSNAFKNWAVCKANYHNIREFYQILSEIGKAEDSLLKQYNLKSVNAIWEDIFKTAEKSGKYNEVIAEFKKDVQAICDKNVQFCARNMKTEFLTSLKFTAEEVQGLIDRAIYGPYTDIAFARTTDEAMVFMKIGYELIGTMSEDIILGCRLCSDREAIRFMHVGESHQDKFKILSGKIDEKISKCPSTTHKRPCNLVFGDTTDIECPGVNYHSLRMDVKSVLIYEKVPLGEYTQTVSKIYPFRPYKGKNIDIAPQYGIWDSKSNKWVGCSQSAQGSQPNTHPELKKLCRTCSADLFATDNNSIKVPEGQEGSLGLAAGDTLKLNNDHLKLQMVSESEKPGTNEIFFIKNKKEKPSTNLQLNEYSDYSIGFDPNKNDFEIQNIIKDKKIPIKYNHYNWIYIDQFFMLTKDITSKIKQAFETTIINFSLDYKMRDLTGVNQPVEYKFNFHLIQFQPFNPPANSNYLSEDLEASKQLCNSMCALKEQKQKTACNFSEDSSFDEVMFSKYLSTEKSDAQLDKVFKRGYYKSKYTKGINSVKVLTKKLEEANPEITFNNLDMFKDLAGFSSDVVRMKIEVDKNKKHSHLCFTRQNMDNKEYAFVVNVRFCEKGDLEEEYAHTLLFRMPSKDVGGWVIQVFFVKESGADLFNNSLVQLNRNYLIKRISGKYLNDNTYVFIYIQPRPSSGFVPFVEHFDTSSFSFFSECRSEFHKALAKTHCYEVRGKCADPYLNTSGMDLSYYNLMRSSFLFKLHIEKLYRYNLKSYNIKEMFNLESSSFPGSCTSINAFVPVKFHFELERKHPYRNIEVKDGVITEKFEEAGPGIRRVYYLQFKHEYQEDSQNLKIAEKYGYAVYKSFDVVINDKNFNVVVWVAFDYRLREKRSDICVLCKDSEKKSVLPGKQNLNKISGYQI